MRTVCITLPPMHTDVPSSKHVPISSEVTVSFQRLYNRLCIVCPVMFASAPFIGEGSIHNLSQSGCRIECDRTVLRGSYITVRVLIPDESRSLNIDLAAVRWIGMQCFGIEFLRISIADRTRLEQFLRAARPTQISIA